MTGSEYAIYVQETRIEDARIGKLSRTDHAIWSQLMRNLEWATYLARRNLGALQKQAMCNTPAATPIALAAADAQLQCILSAARAHRPRDPHRQLTGN